MAAVRSGYRQDPACRAEDQVIPGARPAGTVTGAHSERGSDEQRREEVENPPQKRLVVGFGSDIALLELFALRAEQLAGRRGVEGNGGVTSTVFRTPWSIGYVEQAYSQGLVLPFAEIRNQAGNYVLPTTQTITAAAQKPAITPTDFSIVNQPGASSYPISGYSWALVYTRQADQASGQALVTMLDWLTHDGQAYAAANLYGPLPAQVRQLALTMLQQVTGPGGTHLLS